MSNCPLCNSELYFLDDNKTVIVCTDRNCNVFYKLDKESIKKLI